MMKGASLATLCMVCTSLIGCDLVQKSTRILAEGVVMDSSLLKPAEGISVALVEKGGGFGAYDTVERTLTDAQGRFSLDYDPRGFTYGVRVEMGGSGWRGTQYEVTAGRSNRTVWLHRTTSLTAMAQFSSPLGPSDWYILWVPGVGISNGDATTERAKANAQNPVTLEVSRNGIRSSTTRYVYCPLGTHTQYTFDL